MSNTVLRRQYTYRLRRMRHVIISGGQGSEVLRYLPEEPLHMVRLLQTPYLREHAELPQVSFVDWLEYYIAEMPKLKAAFSLASLARRIETAQRLIVYARQCQDGTLTKAEAIAAAQLAEALEQAG